MRILIYIYDNTDMYICMYVEKITRIYRCMTRVFKVARERAPKYDNTHIDI